MGLGPKHLSRLTRTLQRWGDWQEIELTRSAYPSVNVLSRIAQTGIPDAFRPGHRILAREMPAELQCIQRAWMALETDQARQVIWVKYVCDRDDTGKPITDAQRAGLLECSILDFNGLLLSARRELRRILKYKLGAVSG